MRDQGIPFLVATTGMALASARRRTGDLSGSLELLDELAGLAAALGNEWVGARVHLERSQVALDRGESEDAEGLAHSALSTFSRLGRCPDILSTLELLGLIAAADQSEAEALRCLAAAAAERSRVGVLALPPDAERVARVCDEIRAEIGDTAADEFWAEGAQLSLEDVVEYVSRARGKRKRPRSGWASLTPTELRVIDLVAEGLTNPQIAQRMFIARGTVKVHVSHIFAKLGVSSRAELATMAARRSAARSGVEGEEVAGDGGLGAH
jgi:DNA-binding NarL/FixJ family response regulator